MTSVEVGYANELAASRQRLTVLRERAAGRSRARGDPVPASKPDALGGAPAGDTSAERASDANGAVDGGAGSELHRRIAAFLLDPANAAPLDSHKMHRELSKPEGGGKAYTAALGEGGGVSSLEKALREMGGGDSGALELEGFEVAGKQRVMVLGINRSRLVSLLGRDPAQPDVPLPSPPLRAVGVPDPPPPPFRPGPFDSMGGGRPPFAPGSMMPPANGGIGGGPPGFRPLMPGPNGPMHGAGGSMPGPPGGGMPVGGPPFGGMRPGGTPGPPGGPGVPPPPQAAAKQHEPAPDSLEALLGRKSIRDRQKTEKGEEVLELLQKPTAKENAVVEKFRTGGASVREYCPQLTKEDCCRANGTPAACGRLHFRRLLFPWTDVSLGNCSYLDTCRHMHNCKFVHYELDETPAPGRGGPAGGARQDRPPVPPYLQALPEPQWINCDVRKFDMSILGKFGVIMTDPPWEIHQDLPYGTMADDEMRKLNIGCLQDDGVIFVWVTGRAMELGRECLEIWGYKRVDELIWVKTNQLQRLIRTGRTGHWLNHSKEHCLVGYKGNPQLNRGVDCDVVVAEVRETSRKPDELYSLLERLSPGTRKLEIFARQHNCQPGWVGLGNQLSSNRITDPMMRERYERVYGSAADSGGAGGSKGDGEGRDGGEKRSDSKRQRTDKDRSERRHRKHGSDKPRDDKAGAAEGSKDAAEGAKDAAEVGKDAEQKAEGTAEEAH